MNKKAVGHDYNMSKSISFDKQKELIKKWIDSDTHPRIALIGLLSLIHAFSAYELTNIKLTDINENVITVPNRQVKNVMLADQITEVLNRYLVWRQQLLHDAKCDYLIVSRVSYKKNVPVTQGVIYGDLKKTGISARQLRATRLIDLSQKGNLKLLEGILTYEGARPYYRVPSPKLMGIQNTPRYKNSSYNID